MEKAASFGHPGRLVVACALVTCLIVSLCLWAAGDPSPIVLAPRAAIAAAILASVCQLIALISLLRVGRVRSVPASLRFAARALTLLALLTLCLPWILLWAVLRTPVTVRGSVPAATAPSGTYPLSGFWRVECSVDAGLDVRPTDEAGLYLVTFCGATGCLDGSAEKTPILDDRKYRIPNDQTLEVVSALGVARFHRCP